MKKRFLSLLLTLAMTAGLLSGCGNSGGDNKTDDSQQEEPGNTETETEEEPGNTGAETGEEPSADGEVYEMVMEVVNFGYDDPDLAKVQDAVNEITVPKIGVKVKFLTVPIMEMSTKLGLLVAGNEKIDLAVTGLLTTPGKLVADGLLLPITDLIQKSEVLKEKAGDLIEACTVNGEVYSYPGSLYPGLKRGLLYDVDLAEEYNINIPEKITSTEELTAFFKQVKESGMSQYPLSLGDGVAAETSWLDMETLGDASYYTYGVIMDAVNGTTVENLYATETYKEKCLAHREWFEKGYAVPDSISNGYTTIDSMTQGMIFSFATPVGVSMSTSYWSSISGKHLEMIELSEDVIIDSASIYRFCWGIPATCENPEKVVNFLELLYSDMELANLLNNGIEGEHYVTQEGSSIINYPEGIDSSSVGYGSFVGSYGDLAGTYLKAPLTDEFIADIPDYGAEKAVVSKYLGYTFDTSPVTTEITAVTAVISQYGPALECGTVDPETTIPEFLEALEAAGMNKIIEENQKQIDAFLAQ